MGWLQYLVNSANGISTLAGLPGYFVKVACLLTLALVVLSLFSRKDPALRNLIMRAALAGVAMLTAVVLLAPSWEIAYPKFVGSLFLGTPAVIAGRDAAQSLTGNINWSQVLLFAWLAGIGIFVVRYLSGFLSMRHIVRASAPCDDRLVHELAVGIQSNLNIGRPVSIRTSETASMPMAWGLVHPVVIIPSRLASDTRSLQMVLSHELAHIRRADILWLNLASILVAVHWFNPLAWIARRKLLKESEYACDDFVLASGARGQEYARHLLESAYASSNARPVVLTGTAYTTQLEGRIMSILTHRVRNAFVTKRLSSFVLTLAVITVLPLSVFTFQARQSSSNDAYAAPLPVGVVQSSAKGFPSPTDFVAVDSMPVMLRFERPVYPPSARKEGVEGNTFVRSLLDTTGSIIKIEVATSSGDARLDSAAVEAGRKNKFTPALKDGKPVAIWITYKVAFVLSDKK